MDRPDRALELLLDDAAAWAEKCKAREPIKVVEIPEIRLYQAWNYVLGKVSGQILIGASENGWTVLGSNGIFKRREIYVGHRLSDEKVRRGFFRNDGLSMRRADVAHFNPEAA